MELTQTAENLPFTPERITQIEKVLLHFPQIDAPVIHHFGPSIYIREVKIPADSFAIGHHQNFEHLNIFLQGRVTILNEDGSTTELKAPMLFTGKPGRKVGYIHEDMIWLNIYATKETDVEELESHFLTKSDSWTEDQQVRSQMLTLQHKLDREDFNVALKEWGLTAEEVRAQSENTEDMTELPYSSYKIKVDSSKIEGRGLFATAPITSGETIAPARLNSKRTIAGRYTNHSIVPNAKMIRGPGSDMLLVATREIRGSQGGQNGEEITINYRDAVKLNISIAREGT